MCAILRDRRALKSRGYRGRIGAVMLTSVFCRVDARRYYGST